MTNAERVREQLTDAELTLSLEKTYELVLATKWEARGRQEIIDLLKSGKSSEEIIRNYDAHNGM